MPSGGSHLQGAARRVLPGHVREVGEVRAVLPAGPGPGEARSQSRPRHEQSGQYRVRPAGRVARFLLGDLAAGEDRDELAQAAYAQDRDIRYERGLGRALPRHHHLPVAGLGRGEDRRQDSADRAHPAVQTQLPDQDEVGDRAGVHHLGGPEHGRGDGQVEAGAGFRYGSRAQPDRELLLRPGRTRVDHGRPDPVPALDQGLVRQPHQGEGGHARLQVGLYLDHHAVDPDQGHRAGPCEPHQATPDVFHQGRRAAAGAPRPGRSAPRPGAVRRGRRASARRARASARP